MAQGIAVLLQARELDPEVKKVLKTVDELLASLPKEKIDQFTKTKDYDLYKKVVTLDCVEGWSVTILWEGVLVRDLLAQAKPLPEAKVIIFHAYDGYTTSLPIDYIMNNDIIMAYQMNEVTLPPERGFPFQLVAESKWGYKWIKWITEIELSSDVNYRGYWESQGYSNEGDLNEGFFGF